MLHLRVHRLEPIPGDERPGARRACTAAPSYETISTRASFRRRALGQTTAMTMPHDAARFARPMPPAYSHMAAEHAQARLDRLLELRAVIDTLRTERVNQLLDRLGILTDQARLP